MTLSLHTNMAAAKAGLNLSKNQANLQKSLERLSSGKRITEASDDAGGLAVAMKIESTIGGLKANANTIANGISFLQAREGVMDQMSQVVNRISELKSMSENMLLTNAEIDASVGPEHEDLIAQLTSLMGETFNGVAFFGAASNYTVYTKGGSANALGAMNPAAETAITDIAYNADSDLRDDTVTATHIASAIDYVASIRSENAGELSKLQFAQTTVQNEINGLQSALGRITDVDVAAESANLAKQQILVQASASMVAQANAANNAALLLLQ